MLALSVVFGKVMCAKPEVKYTNLWYTVSVLLQDVGPPNKVREQKDDVLIECTGQNGGDNILSCRRSVHSTVESSRDDCIRYIGGIA